MYYKIEQYLNDKGHIIICKTPQKSSEDLISSNIFLGKLSLSIKTPQGHTAQVPFEFEFPTNMSLDECFANFETIATNKLEEAKQKQKDNNLIVPAKSIPKI